MTRKDRGLYSGNCVQWRHSAGTVHKAMTHIHSLQGQVKDAEGRADMAENMADRANTMVRSLEGKLREIEIQVDVCLMIKYFKK